MADDKTHTENLVTLEDMNKAALSVQDHLNTLCYAMVIVKDAYTLFKNNNNVIAQDAILESIKSNIQIERGMDDIAMELHSVMVKSAMELSKKIAEHKNGKD